MSQGSLYLITAFYEDDSTYPNIRGVNRQQRVHIYWENVCVMLATAVWYGVLPSGTQLIIFTNSVPPTVIGRQLESLGVSIRETRFTFQPPGGYWGTFSGAFYLVDAMRVLAQEAGDRDTLLFLDPDCVVVSSLLPLIEEVRRTGVVAYPTQMLPEDVANGMSQTALQRLGRELDGQDLPLRYYGGELYGLDGRSLKHVSRLCSAVWPQSLERFREGRDKFNTEEHLLSYALSRAGVAVSSAEGYIRRIWTAATHNTTQPDDLKLTIWHLPAEKKRGMRQLYKLFSKSQRHMRVELFRPRAARLLGLRPSPQRRVHDQVIRTAKRFLQANFRQGYSR